MLTYPDGRLMVEKAISGLNVAALERKIVTVVRDQCERFDAEYVLHQAFGDRVEVCVLDDYTSSQSETVAATIERMGVTGPFIAKDSDGYVRVNLNDWENFLVGIDLRKNLEVTNVAGKSFLVLNEQGLIVDIIEKSVCSNVINIGVYGFRSAAEFLDAYRAVSVAWDTERSPEVYLSHVVSFLIGQGSYFAYKEAIDYEDWGLLSDWHRARRARRTYFVDVDGVVFRNKGQYGPVNWDSEDVPLSQNVETLKRLAGRGAQIIFCTARPEGQRGKLEASLSRCGFAGYVLVMGCNHAQRVIINDFAKSNPYPSCRAINMARDEDSLAEYLNETD